MPPRRCGGGGGRLPLLLGVSATAPHSLRDHCPQDLREAVSPDVAGDPGPEE